MLYIYIYTCDCVCCMSSHPFWPKLKTLKLQISNLSTPSSSFANSTAGMPRTSQDVCVCVCACACACVCVCMC